MATDRTTAHPVSSSTQEPVAVAASRELPERRRYAPPQLRHLGSVRDLTLGLRNGGFEVGRPGMHV